MSWIYQALCSVRVRGKWQTAVFTLDMERQQEISLTSVGNATFSGTVSRSVQVCTVEFEGARPSRLPAYNIMGMVMRLIDFWCPGRRYSCTAQPDSSAQS